MRDEEKSIKMSSIAPVMEKGKSGQALNGEGGFRRRGKKKGRSSAKQKGRNDHTINFQEAGRGGHMGGGGGEGVSRVLEKRRGAVVTQKLCGTRSWSKNGLFVCTTKGEGSGGKIFGGAGGGERGAVANEYRPFWWEVDE